MGEFSKVKCPNCLAVGDHIQVYHNLEGDTECLCVKCHCAWVFIVGRTEPDLVHSPSHYKLDGLGVESIDVVKAVLGEEGFRAFCRGNAMKYLIRAGKKGDELEDLRKAEVYIGWAVKGRE